ncbi:RDD family protein [Actinomadura harenae]|uniref:RDD family protein n=1 Tax=Actinomadura harenae TaxID=2483351 RepID=UPI0018F58366|nr:RDD family protein [Actinomadura harenae]
MTAPDERVEERAGGPGAPGAAAAEGVAAAPAGGPVDGAAVAASGEAEPGQRLLARIVDTLAVGLPVVLVLRAVLPHDTADHWSPTAVASALLVYEAVQLALWGRTLGKRVAGVRVVTADGSRPDPARAALRAAVYAVPIALRPVPVLGLLAGIFWVVNVGTAFRGPERRAVHDRMAGTGVVKNTID